MEKSLHKLFEHSTQARDRRLMAVPLTHKTTSFSEARLIVVAIIWTMGS